MEGFENKLAGFIEVNTRNCVSGAKSHPVAYIEGWYIDKNVRGKGHGARLVSRAEEWAKAEGLTEIGSDALVENERSIAAHISLGFREVDRIVNFLKTI